MAYHNNKYRKYIQGYVFFLSFAKRYGKRLINKGICAAKIFNKSKHGRALKKTRY